MMGKVIAVAVALLAVVSVDVCCCGGGQPPTSRDHKSHSSSDSLQGHYKHSDTVEPRDTAGNLMESAGNKASETMNSVSSAAKEASKYISEKTGEASNKASEIESEYFKDVASDKMDHAMKNVGSNQAREMPEKEMEYKENGEYDSHKPSDEARDAKQMFDESQGRVGEAYDSAKKEMSREAKDTYESAKEKLSKATGALGDKMRNDKEEL